MIPLARHFIASAVTQRRLLVLTLAGAAAISTGLFFSPERIWPGLLVSVWFFLGLGLAGVCFLALTSVINAGWSAAIKRVPEAMGATLIAGVPMLLLLAFGIHTLYEWSHEHVVATDALLLEKSAWLNVTGVVARGVAIVAVWAGFAALLRRTSRRQDDDHDLRHSHVTMRLSAIFLIVAAVTYSLASFDWIMSLEPHWYSTIYGLTHIAGMFESGLAAIALLVILLRRAGAFGTAVTDAHIADLARLLFAFATFWMYLWFCQYLLVWYANIPEETTWYLRREQGGWLTTTVLVVVFNWLIPFVALMSQTTKRNEGLVLRIAIVVLIGRWLDLAWMIFPPSAPDGIRLGLWELGPWLAAIGLFGLLFLRSFARAYTLPVGDPMLVESLHHGADDEADAGSAARDVVPDAGAVDDWAATPDGVVRPMRKPS